MNKLGFFSLHLIGVSSEHSLNAGVSTFLKKHWKIILILKLDVVLFLCIYFLIVCVCMCDRERGEEGEREAGREGECILK